MALLLKLLFFFPIGLVDRPIQLICISEITLLVGDIPHHRHHPHDHVGFNDDYEDWLTWGW